MVKLDNWQTKAQKAAERRHQSKQLKDQKQRTRQNKAQAQQFLAFLQEHSNSILQSSSSADIHIWVDSIPPNNINMDEDQDYEDSSPRKKGGRPRSNSCIVESSPHKGRKGRARSNSDATATSPSSKAAEIPRLCAQHFFGTCSATLIHSSGRRKSTNSNSLVGCVHGIHPPENNGLASALLGKSKKSKNTVKLAPEAVQAAQRALEASHKAAVVKPDDDPYQSTSLDMLHPLTASVSEDSTSLADAVTATLSQNGCSVGSIVYVVFRNLLVFDRNRNGLVLTDLQQEGLLYGRRRSVSIGSDHSDSFHSSSDVLLSSEEEEYHHQHHQRLLQHLPSEVLTYILRFLPESGTAALPLVCKAWHQEIGHYSPDLWRFLLGRHKWPLPPIESGEQDDTTAAHRQAFVSHYLAARDVKVMTLGMSQFMGTDGCTTASKDLAMFQFKDSIGRPITGPALLEVWGADTTRVLVGSAMDCTLHLYDIIDCSNETGKRCKQSLRVSVAPFSNTRRRHCMLAAMKLDAQAIACLYEVGDNNDRREVWLGVLPREDLLCAGKGGSEVPSLEEGVLTTFNLQSKVFECIQTSCDDEIVCWLYNHGLSGEKLEIGFLSIVVCNKLVACGDGQYLVEAHISLSDDDVDSLFEPDLQFPTLGKIFLFSSCTGEFTWVSPSNCDSRFATLSQVGCQGGPRAAFLSSLMEAVVLDVQGPGGVVLCSHIIIPNPICGTPRFVAMSSTALLLADEWIGSIEDDTSNKGNLHLLSLTGGASSVQDSMLDGTFFGPVVPLRDDYLIAFATAEEEEDEEKVELVARLLHTPSRKVIHEAAIGITFTPEYLRRHSPISMSCAGGPLAVAIDEIGLFVAGHGVSEIQDKTWGKKTKKKKGVRSRPKKDGFARGVRQTMG